MHSKEIINLLNICIWYITFTSTKSV